MSDLKWYFIFLAVLGLGTCMGLALSEKQTGETERARIAACTTLEPEARERCINR